MSRYRSDSYASWFKPAVTEADLEYVRRMQAEYERDMAARIEAMRIHDATRHPGTCLCAQCMTEAQRYLDWKKDRKLNW